MQFYRYTIWREIKTEKLTNGSKIVTNHSKIGVLVNHVHNR